MYSVKKVQNYQHRAYNSFYIIKFHFSDDDQESSESGPSMYPKRPWGVPAPPRMKKPVGPQVDLSNRPLFPPPPPPPPTHLMGPKKPLMKRPALMGSVRPEERLNLLGIGGLTRDGFDKMNFGPEPGFDHDPQREAVFPQREPGYDTGYRREPGFDQGYGREQGFDRDNYGQRPDRGYNDGHYGSRSDRGSYNRNQRMRPPPMPPMMLRRETVTAERIEMIPGINPVLKAVVNNALGNLPLKRKQYSGRCDACNIPFTDETQEQAHYNGKKHAKKMRNLGLGKNSPFQWKEACKENEK